MTNNTDIDNEGIEETQDQQDFNQTEDIGINDVDQVVQEEEDAQQEVDTLKEQLQLEKDKFLRLFADFENFKRRTSKERIELFKTAGEGVLKDLLPVLDDFDRAINEINKSGEDGLSSGVVLISNKLRNTLKSKGLEEIEVNPGDVFNADNHEAVTQIPASSDDMKGKIVDVIEKGYRLGDKIIRFPKVVIAK